MRPPRPPQDWDQRFLQLARTVAGWSKDPSTKVGAVCVRERRVLASGYNGFPQLVDDHIARLRDRNTRLLLTVHAEANVIAYAARHGVCLHGGTIYVFPLMTCNQCAAQLIQAGISRVVVPNFVEPLRWQESFDAARQMFIEASIPVARIPLNGVVEPALDGDEDELLPVD